MSEHSPPKNPVSVDPTPEPSDRHSQRDFEREKRTHWRRILRISVAGGISGLCVSFVGIYGIMAYVSYDPSDGVEVVRLAISTLGAVAGTAVGFIAGASGEGGGSSPE